MKKILLIAPLALSLLLASCNGNEKSGGNTGSGDNPTSQTTDTSSGGSTPSSGGGDTTSDVTPKDPVVSGISFNSSMGKNTIDKNEETTFQAFVSGLDGNDAQGNIIEYSRKATFSTNDPSVLQLTPVADNPSQPKAGSKVTVKGLKGGSAKLIATSVGDDSKTVETTIQVRAVVDSIISVVSKPESVFLNKSIDPQSVELSVRFDDGSTVNNYHPDRVTCDTSVVGPATARAIIDLDDELFLDIEFQVEVLAVIETQVVFIDQNFDDAQHLFTCGAVGDGFDGSSYTGRGVQVTSEHTTFATSKETYSNIVGVEVVCSSNGGSGTIEVEIGGNNAYTIEANTTTLPENNTSCIKMFNAELSGTVKLTINHTGSTKSLYVKSISIMQRKVQTGLAVLTSGKDAYEYGETFDIDEFVIVPQYNVGIGDASEAIDHTLLSVSNENPLTVNTTITVSQNDTDYSVDIPVTVHETMPEFINVQFNDADYGYLDEDTKHINIPVGETVLYETSVTVDPSAARKQYEFISENECASFDGLNTTIDLTGITEEFDFVITFRYTHLPTVSTSYTVHVYNPLAPHLSGVRVASFDSSQIVTPQYEGKEFDYSGIVFEADFTNGKDSEVIEGSAIQWAALVAGEDPHGIYNDGTDVASVVVKYSSESFITVLENTLTISFSGDFQQSTPFTFADTWNHDGITANGEYASGDPYTGSFAWSYDPATPSAMGVGADQTLTITATAEDGTHNSTTATVSVVKNSYANSTNLSEGTYLIAYQDGSILRYITSISGGKGATNSDEDLAAKFTFELVADNEWNIKLQSQYVVINDSSTGLRLEDNITDNAALTISWENETLETRKIAGPSGRAMAWYSDNSDIRTYKTASGMTLVPAVNVSEITSISGSVSAKVGEAWSKSELVATGLYEGDSTPHDITGLVTFTISPATATSGDITEVSVTATLKSNSSITLTNEHVAASVVLAAPWQKVAATASFEVGMTIVIVNEANSVVLNGVDKSGSTHFGTQEAFDDLSNNQSYELTVVAGNASGTFALQTSSGEYLCWPSSGNSLSTTATLNNTSSWEVTISSGTATIKNKSDTSRKLQYNKGATRFACYSSSQGSVQIYAK